MPNSENATPFSPADATIAEMAAAMSAGGLTAEQLVLAYLERIAAIDRQGPALNAVLEINPDALFIARALDRERALQGPRGPLHGIPVLLKDNVDTADKLHTSAGSLALAGSFAPRDASVAARLRAAGAVILGKTNMTEWANFMTAGMPDGYSSRGGQVRNPYGPGRLRPGGSSAGSAVAVAAGLAAAAVGTETDGSILDPANQNGIVGIKPTLGLISRSGIIPIAFSQDTAGPLARTVADAALLLGAMAGEDPADPATLAAAGRADSDYTRFLDPAGLRGARIGVPRAGFHVEVDEAQAQLFTAAVAQVRALGAEVIDPAEVPLEQPQYWESSVLTHEFKVAVNAYLAALGPEAPMRNLAEVIDFNRRHPDATLRYGQTLLEAAEATSGTLTEPAYLRDRLADLRRSTTEGIDKVMAQHRLDALLFPGAEGCSIAARAGYPSIIVPAGFTPDDRPMGITFTGLAWSEPALIRYAYAFEQATHHRRPPRLD